MHRHLAIDVHARKIPMTSSTKRRQQNTSSSTNDDYSRRLIARVDSPNMQSFHEQMHKRQRQERHQEVPVDGLGQNRLPALVAKRRRAAPSCAAHINRFHFRMSQSDIPEQNQRIELQVIPSSVVSSNTPKEAGKTSQSCIRGSSIRLRREIANATAGTIKNVIKTSTTTLSSISRFMLLLLLFLAATPRAVVEAQGEIHDAIGINSNSNITTNEDGMNNTLFPTTTAQPSDTPTISSRPSMSPKPSLRPSQAPSSVPTSLPTLTPTEAVGPSLPPTTSSRPSISPTISSKPSMPPTTTHMPSFAPSPSPTLSMQPSYRPSVSPSWSPSSSPSNAPTIEPTFRDIILSTAQFRQKLTIGGGRTFNFNATELQKFQKLYQQYTMQFTTRFPDGQNSVTIVVTEGGTTIVGRVNVTCKVDSQVELDARRLDELVVADWDDGIDAYQSNGQRQLQSLLFNEVDFTMTYKSLHTDVTDYPLLFQTFINANRPQVTLDLQELGLNITEISSASRKIINPEPTGRPTISRSPTGSPSVTPTVSPKPSNIPSDMPSIVPTQGPPSAMPIQATNPPTRTQSSSPSVEPTLPIETESPTSSPDDGGGLFSENTIIVVVAVVVGTLLLVGLLICYHRRRVQREQRYQNNAVNSRGGTADKKQKKQQQAGSHREPQETTPTKPGWNGGYDNGYGDDTNGVSNDAYGHPQQYPPRPGPVSLYGSNEDDLYALSANNQQMMRNHNNKNKLMSMQNPGVISPSESLVSNQSLLSAGEVMTADSGDDEVDATHHLADEFDQYKDQNLEKMRADVEGNLTGFDGMMSQALTKALIDDQYDNTSYYGNGTATGSASSLSNTVGGGTVADSLWGGSTFNAGTDTTYALSGLEIEASALGEVMDWLKRKDNTTIEERRVFMQETLNKMVATVRHGVLGPDDASRIIHECAALLGLQLATNIPQSTVIVTGLRKTATAEILVQPFQKFGEIVEAAVASNGKGCGIVRYRHAKSAELAMQIYRKGEILVQDVDVQVTLLKPISDKEG